MIALLTVSAIFLDYISDIATIITALIAVVWFIYSRKLNYFEKGNFTGLYKGFERLRSRQDHEVALIEISINDISNKGWFVGKVDYREFDVPIETCSEGHFNLIGYVKYDVFSDLFTFLMPRTNPLEFDKSRGYKGKLFIVSRNDFNISNHDWKDCLIDTYDITHYRNSFRLSLSNKIGSIQQSHLPGNIFLVNSDIVKT